jgi:hypothetical protein
MVTVPNIPTDSLYKFLALGGLVGVVLISILIDFQQKDLMEKDDLNVKEQISLTDSLPEFYSQYLSKLVKEIGVKKLHQIALKQKSISEEKLASLQNQIDSLELVVRMYEMKVDNLKNRDSLLQSDRRFLASRRKIVNEIISNESKMSDILFFISVIGFFLWYVKIQRYQDIIIRKQAESLMPEKKRQ